MKVKIKAKQHDDATFEFPDTGIVMIQGKSGAGKSTIFTAIKAALKGSERDMARWGGSKSWSVELWFKDLYVKRTGAPNTLEVNISDTTYSGDEAQFAIDKWLDMNDTEFSACSYVQQEQQGSILDLPPSSQEKLVSDLASGKFNVHKMKNVIKEKIKERKKDLEETESKILIEEARLEEAKNNLEEPTKPTEEIKKEKADELRANLLSITKKTETLKKELKELETKLFSDYYKDREALAHIESNFDVDSKNKEIAELRSKLEKLPDQNDTTLADLATELNTLEVKKQWFDARDELVKISKEVRKMCPDMPTNEKIIPFLEKQIYICQEEEKNINQRIFTKDSEIEELVNLPKSQPCPHCEKPLFVIGDQISGSEKNEEQNNEEIKDLSEKRKKLIQDQSRVIEAKTQYEVMIKRSRRFKGVFDHNPAPNIITREEIQEALKKNEKTRKDILKFSQQRASISSRIESVETQIETEKRQLEALRVKVLKYGDFPEKDELIEKKASLQRVLENMEGDKKEIETVLNKRDQYETSLEMYNNAESKYKTKLLGVKEKENIIKELKKQKKHAENRLAGALRLKEKSDFAAVEANEMMLNQINENAAKFIDNLFEEDGTVVKINNVSTTGKGEEKASFSTEIFHKGAKAKKSGLSGGEKSRSCLAFQLGLSDMYNSPLLMVDEGFSGLDEELKSKCLDVLKEVSEDKLILVIEHGAPESFFDKVLHL